MTGNVTGLGYFRGEVDYTAPGEFRGELGDDDLFRFRAQSLTSSPAAASRGGYTVRGYTLAAGQNTLSIYRSLSGVRSSQVQLAPTQNRYAYGDASGDSLGSSGLVVRPSRPAGNTKSILGYSPSENTTIGSGQRIGVYAQPDGKLLELNASPLLGVRRRDGAWCAFGHSVDSPIRSWVGTP